MAASFAVLVFLLWLDGFSWLVGARVGADDVEWRMAAMLGAAAAIGLAIAAAPAWSAGPPAEAEGRWSLSGATVGLALAAMTALGTALRLPGLSLGLWRDESSTYFNALPQAAETVIEAVRFSELNPPAYYFVMHVWIEIFGSGEATLKLPSLIFGLLLIPVCYAVGAAAGSRFAGLLAAALITLSPHAIYLSQEARPYTMGAMVCGLALAIYLRALVSPRRGALLALFVLAGAAALYTHYTSLVLLAALGGATGALYMLRRDPLGLAPYAAAFLAILALYLPWVGTFLSHLATGTPWTPEQSVMEIPVLLLKNIAYALPWDRVKWIDGPLALAIVLGVALVFVRASVRARSAATPVGKEEMLGVLAAAFAGPAVVLAAMSYSDRYMFLFLPAALALFGVWIVRGAAELSDRGRAIALPVCLAAFFGWFLVQAPHYATVDDTPKSGVPGFAEAYGEEQDVRTVYALSPDYLGPTFGYYFRDRDVAFFGVGRSEDPHIFSPRGYAEIWNRGDVVEAAEAQVRDFAAQGRDRLALIQSGCGEANVDRGLMPYSLADVFASRIEATYPVIGQETYPGEWECVNVRVFDIGRTRGEPAS